MGITTDDYKRVVNKMLAQEEALEFLQKSLLYKQTYADNLVEQLTKLGTKLAHAEEDLAIRQAQYEKLLAFYHDVRERSQPANGHDDTWILTYENESGMPDTYSWEEVEDGLPNVEASS